GVDGVELRVDRLERHPTLSDFESVRAASTLELIMTRRTTADYGVPVDEEIAAALRAGFEWLDVEYTPRLDAAFLERHRANAILSFHDFAGMPNLESLFHSMRDRGCARVKIAVTPRSFADNTALLALSADHEEEPLTVIGMGGRGLYSRILAPFFGSDLVFAASSAESIAAPGQLTLAEALEIFGRRRQCPSPRSLFAVVGNPASHSRSPMIHNRIFFESSACAAYSIAETETFLDVAEPFARGDRFAPAGMSITAPFKADAYAFAAAVGARIAPRAIAARAVNTLVRESTPQGPVFFADNTDVEGFRVAFDALGAASGSAAAVVGAGGTARAALVAAREAGLRVTIFNRSEDRATGLAREYGCEAKTLRDFAAFEGDLVLNTIRGDASLEPPSAPFVRGARLVDVGYGAGQPMTRVAHEAGREVFDGLRFLEAQAIPQSRLFMKAVPHSA
ncbi:MAG: type I 3-dehydroquinate dehydratase, partial [Acidobacteria bacterium]|nr:type I 3-dehydroquinate dehydratase [Acidobacteriota bacterium]